MNWTLIATTEGGIRVADGSGREFAVYWEQKRSLLDIGILAVRPLDDSPPPMLTLLTGEVEGLDMDTEISGVVRDPGLMQLWRQEGGDED
jgi:hypothetical protein